MNGLTLFKIAQMLHIFGCELRNDSPIKHELGKRPW